MTDQATEQSSGPLDSVEQAMAELDRRDAARAAEKGDEAEPEEGEEAEEPEEAEAEEADEGDEPEKKEPVEEGSDALEVAGQKIEIPKSLPAAQRQQIAEIGHQMQSHFTKVTQEAAQESQVAQQARQQLANIARQAVQEKQALAQMAQAIIGKEPDIALVHTDPQTYLLQKEIFQRNSQQYQALLQSVGLSQQQAQQLQSEHAANALRAEQARMVKELPELADSSARQAFTQRAVKVAEKYGFSESDVMSVNDHRTLKMLKDLVRLQDMETQQAKAVQKVRSAPPQVVKQESAAPEKARVNTKEFIKQRSKGRELSLRDVRGWATKS